MWFPPLFVSIFTTSFFRFFFFFWLFIIIYLFYENVLIELIWITSIYNAVLFKNSTVFIQLDLKM